MRAAQALMRCANFTREDAMDQGAGHHNVWSVILSGGEGERLRPLISQWLGSHKPKQYCTFVGTRSMLQHTLDRADRISAPEHKVTVIARCHHEEALRHFREREAGRLVLQPSNRDTAAGIFLALSHVRAHDSRGTVVIFPSDHFICPEEPFFQMVRSMVRAAKQIEDRLFLLGVAPDRVELEYGWIHQGHPLGRIDKHRLHAVQGFVEKPVRMQGWMTVASQALWNTLILAGRVETLWVLGWRCFPEVMVLFEKYCKAIGTCQEQGTLEEIYQEMPATNFSSGLLEHVSQHISALELSGVLWCDWGKPERIVESLQRIGKIPTFSPALAAAAGAALPLPRIGRTAPQPRFPFLLGKAAAASCDS
jgi:mannose-1-phosphate guanylyltransferase